jgi:hypothetical protein
VTAPSAKRIVGLDVGGANLKYANLEQSAISRRFALWQHPQRLAEMLADDLRTLGRLSGGIDALAVTMTGELADCFADRAEGVEHIVAHCCQAAGQLGINCVAFYGVDGRFRQAAQAVREVDRIAAANWHALASFLARRLPGRATVIDVGSTTTDIIPIEDGRVATAATTDHQRLVAGNLVYVGCRRTPVCALVDRLRYRGRESAVMNELFATIDDARLLLGSAAEDAGDCDSADGKPRTRCFAANRLARMIGLDRRSVSIGDAEELAAQVLRSAKQPITEAIGELPPASTVILSGHGDDLIDLPHGHPIMRVSDQLGAAVARCAPSYAVASLYHALCGDRSDPAPSSRSVVGCDGL